MGSDLEFMCAECFTIWDRPEAIKTCEGVLVCPECISRHTAGCYSCRAETGSSLSFSDVAHRTRTYRC